APGGVSPREPWGGCQLWASSQPLPARAGRASRRARGLGSAQRAVYEDVGDGVRVAGDEARRLRVEDHVAPVGRDRGAEAVAVALLAAGGDAHAAGPVLPSVVDEDVGLVVGIAGDEVRRIRVEVHVAPVGRDRGVEAVAVPLLAAGGHAHAAGPVLASVVDEDV